MKAIHEKKNPTVATEIAVALSRCGACISVVFENAYLSE